MIYGDERVKSWEIMEKMEPFFSGIESDLPLSGAPFVYGIFSHHQRLRLRLSVSLPSRILELLAPLN